MQSVPSEHELNSEPGPPSSQSRSPVYGHVLVHVLPPTIVGDRIGGDGGGGITRGPQSWQSVPKAQKLRPSEPAPPSWQMPLRAAAHVLEQPVAVVGDDGALPPRGPQSMQSVPSEHELNSEPGPPSSQSRSPVYGHVLEQPPTTARGGGGAP